MGTRSEAEIDAWLSGGGLVVAASERAARALAAAYHRARRAEGLTAWPAPMIQDWQGFVRAQWDQRSLDGRLVLNPLQEQSLWAEIVAADGKQAALLEGPRQRVAGLAAEAHRLLCLYAPRLLRAASRAGWQQDPEAFSGWLAAFDDACRVQNLVSAAQLPLELIDAIESESGPRPPLLLAGFDRILPTQRRLLEAWSEWREAPRNDSSTRIFSHQARDEQAELAACVLWCRRQLAANPDARLLIVTQDVARRRGEMERAFLRFAGAPGVAPRLEFSLGVPLRQIALARGAHMLLRWLAGAIEEHELDWLLSTGQTAANEQESQALTAVMRALRRRGLERPRWTFDSFIVQRPRVELPAAWVARMAQARRKLDESARRSNSAIAWAELVPQLLQMAGWPGARAFTSAEFQGMRRWQRAVDDCASLGFSGRRLRWAEFLASLERTVNETLFAPESQDAPILIAGPAESAGLEADALWFMGAGEDAWPAGGATHPFLPPEMQRETAMPHASPRLDWELATAMTERLLASAPEAHFSYARQSEGVEARPSRLIAKVAGTPIDLPAELIAPPIPKPLTVPIEDQSQVPFPYGEIAGGASVLTAQSQCAFKAFANARLGAQDWEPAEAGLTARQRGQLLHAVLHSVWDGPPTGIGSHAELVAIKGLHGFVEEHVRRVLRDKMPAGAREQMPQRYLELEETRLIDLVTEWLEYEITRVPFTVVETEADESTSIVGLALRLRLDRIDRLIDDSLLVVDYKTGDVKPSLWDLPRPDDVQLPLYAGFALDQETETLGGLVFAKVRTGELSFAGRVGDAKGLLMPGLGATSALVQNKLEAEDLIAWREYIEKMARDFLRGRAEVDPREPPKTCERCGLQTLCRISENQPQPEDDEENSEEAGDA
jgi:probable DNA repair protein